MKKIGKKVFVIFPLTEFSNKLTLITEKEFGKLCHTNVKFQEYDF
jgi:hypothetical protein